MIDDWYRSVLSVRMLCPACFTSLGTVMWNDGEEL